MKLITIHKKDYQVPESWDELTARQLRAVMDILFIRNSSSEAKVIGLLGVLMGLRPMAFRKLDIHEVEEYIYLVHFLLEANMKITRNPLPCYKHINQFGLTKKFYGPADECMNLVMKEFVFLENYFMEWFDNKEDHEALNQLVAILYRPAKSGYDKKKNPDGDIREDFNQNISEYNAKHFVKYWPNSVKLGIAYFYNGCRRQFVENNPNVFKGGDGDPSRYGLISLMRSVAAEGVHGDFTKVENTLVTTILMELNEMVDQAEMIKRNSTVSA